MGSSRTPWLKKKLLAALNTSCHTVQAKGPLVRLVRTPEGVFPDLQGKRPGRGAYLHNRPECWETGLAGSLAHALRTTLTGADQQRLRDFFSLNGS